MHVVPLKIPCTLELLAFLFCFVFPLLEILPLVLKVSLRLLLGLVYFRLSLHPLFDDDLLPSVLLLLHHHFTFSLILLNLFFSLFDLFLLIFQDPFSLL